METDIKNDGNMPQVLAGLEMGAYLKTVHSGHDHIQQDQVGRIVLANRQGLGSAGRHEDLVLAREGLVHDLDINRLVIHHQQFGLAVDVV